MEHDKELKRNGSGCSDPTAYEAIKRTNNTTEDDKFHKLLHTIFDVCDLAGFRVEGRMVLIDKETGIIHR